MMLLPESMANTRNPNEYNTNYVFATQSELSRISLAGALSSWPFRSGGRSLRTWARLDAGQPVRRRLPAHHVHIIRSVPTRHPT